MEPGRAIRTALACALALVLGLFFSSIAAASTQRRESGSLGPIIATSHTGAVIAKRAIRIGSALDVDQRDQSISREADDGSPMHASLPPASPVVAPGGFERADAPLCTRSPARRAPSRRWAEARAPPAASPA